LRFSAGPHRINHQFTAIKLNPPFKPDAFSGK